MKDTILTVAVIAVIIIGWSAMGHDFIAGLNNIVNR